MKRWPGKEKDTSNEGHIPSAPAQVLRQPAVAEMEQRADIYVSNLGRYIEALGGKLAITARFPDASITLKNFVELTRPGKITVR